MAVTRRTTTGLVGMEAARAALDTAASGPNAPAWARKARAWAATGNRWLSDMIKGNVVGAVKRSIGWPRAPCGTVIEPRLETEYRGAPFS